MIVFLDTIKCSLHRLFFGTMRENRLWCILLYLAFICGLVLGLCFADFGQKNIFAMDYFVEYFTITFNPNLSIFALLARRVWLHLQFFIFLAVLSIGMVFLPVKIVFVLYRGYVLGVAVLSILYSCGIAGAMCCLLLVIPQQFFIVTCFNIQIIRVAPITRSFKRYRCFHGFWEIVWLTFLIYLCSLIVCLFEIVIVFCVIRPFNLSI